MKRSFLAFFLILGSLFSLCAQKKENTLQLFTGVDFVSRHSWRGGMEGGAPSIEPTFELRKGKWSVGAWFAATLDDKYKELDLYVTYAPTSQLSLSLFDYYCPPSKLSEAKFYKFQKAETQHLFDFVVNYQFKSIPLKLTAATLFAGMDTNKEGDLRYSTYLEAAYTQPIGNFELTGMVAGTPWESIYAHKADFVNLELKLTQNLKLQNVDFPIFGRIVHNPHREKTYYIAGFSFYGLSNL